MSKYLNRKNMKKASKLIILSLLFLLMIVNVSVFYKGLETMDTMIDGVAFTLALVAILIFMEDL